MQKHTWQSPSLELLGNVEDVRSGPNPAPTEIDGFSAASGPV